MCSSVTVKYAMHWKKIIEQLNIYTKEMYFEIQYIVLCSHLKDRHLP